MLRLKINAVIIGEAIVEMETEYLNRIRRRNKVNNVIKKRMERKNNE